MDNFYEQLVVINKTIAKRLLIVLLWLAVIAISTVCLILLLEIGVLLTAGLLFLAYKLTGMTTVEYEYIITNGEMDVDKIVAKSKRTRVKTFKCAEIEKIEKYTPSVTSSAEDKKVLYCGNINENTYIFRVRHEKDGLIVFVLEPNERLRKEIYKYLQYSVKKSVEDWA